jgi:ABC-2 type transport system permease protein
MSTQPSKSSAQKPSNPFWELLKIEGRLALREPTGIIFGIGLPAFLLLIFALIPSFGKTVPGTTLTVFQSYIPILMVTVLIILGLLSLPIPIARDREIGWLRRISTTPVPPSRLLAAQLTINVVLAALALGILTVGSAVILGATGAIDVLGFVLTIVLATVAMFSLGLVIAALAPSQGSAAGMGTVLLYPLLFFAGIYVPIQYLPSSLQTVSHFTPVGAAVQALESAIQGAFPSVVPLLVMAAYSIFFGFVATRYFKWE